MRLVSLKADGSTHRTWLEAARTHAPNTFYIRQGAPVQENLQKIWSSNYPVVAFFWPKIYFQVFMLLKPHCTDYYCNVITPPLFGADVFFIDLELDVVVTEGVASVVDEEEFRSRTSLYPTLWITQAQCAVERLLQMIEQQEGPFRPAVANAWRAMCTPVIS